jgi:hypothetical protein
MNFLHSASLRDVGNLIRTVFIVYPMALLLIGGVSKQGWAWFAGFCVFLVSGQAPLLMGGLAMFALLLLPAVFCLWMFLRNAPNIPLRMGYMEKFSFIKEILFSVLLSFLFVTLTYYFLTRVGHYRFTALSPFSYFVLAVNGFANYVVVFGFAYGIMTRRLLSMRYEPFVPIVFNVLFIFAMWAPAAVASGKILLGLISVFAIAVLSQLSTGMAFFFCRSTRIVLISYLVYYLFHKSIPLVR